MPFPWLNLFLVVLVAWGCGALVTRLGYPHVLGELAAGIIFGPPLLGWVHGDEVTAILGKLGVLMMILFIGARVNPMELAKSAGPAALPTLAGFLVPCALGYFAVTGLLGGSSNAGLLVGTVIGTTALVTMSRVLVDLNLLGTRMGQTLMAVALFSIILVLISFSAIQGIVASGGVDVGKIAIVLGKAFAFLALIVALGMWAFPILGKLHAKVDRHPGSTDELTFAVMLATIVAFAAEAFGLSFILGSFLTGLFLREEMFEEGAFAGVLSALRDASLGFLAPIFYVSAGFNVSFKVFHDPKLVIVIILAALIGKFGGGMIGALMTRRNWRESLVMGAGMNARGSIDIIVATAGLQLKIISQDFYSALILMIFLSNVIVPIVLKAGRDWLSRRGELVPVESAAPAKVSPPVTAPAPKASA